MNEEINEMRSFHPTIPITVRRDASEHLADGTAQVLAAVGPTGFTTRYLTALSMVDGHQSSELLSDEACQLVLSTGHVLAGHFYPNSEASDERTVLVFIPSGTSSSEGD
jgi:hypothetical protein